MDEIGYTNLKCWKIYRIVTCFMNDFHLGGGKAGIEEVILTNVLQNNFISTKEATPLDESEQKLFLEELQSCHMVLQLCSFAQ